MMSRSVKDLKHRLAKHSEAVCRHYLANGRREGGYWLVGDVDNTPGRSMYVHLKRGRWTDAATGEHGDLLDVIQRRRGFLEFRDVADEARAFLALPAERYEAGDSVRRSSSRRGPPEAAQKLFAMSRPIAGSLAEVYLRRRGIRLGLGTASLRFHPHCYYRPDRYGATETWPAMIAAITGLDGAITGAHRTWLDRCGAGKAPIETPRRTRGHLLGNAVRFGVTSDVMTAGEGIETILSLRMALPKMPMAAALSAAHLAAILFPATLRRLYIAREFDPAGDRARDRLIARANAAEIEAVELSPRLEDFNEDLRAFGLEDLRRAIRAQLAPGDAERFMKAPDGPATGR